MVENHTLLPAYEHPPAYSRAPTPLSLSSSHSYIQLSDPQGIFLAGLDDPPFAAPNQILPEYTAFDETSGSFELLAPFVCVRSRNGETRPRYHISQELTRSGKPWRLKIRRVLPTESRNLSNPTSITSSSKARVIEYDDDTTLYVIEDQGALNTFKRRTVEIKGRRANTFPGFIKIRGSRGSTGSCDCWHVTKKSLKKEKYGYHASDDWEKKKLFSTNARWGRSSKVGWADKEGKTLATEDGDTFQVMTDVDQRTKDALITCFVAQKWASGKLPWATTGINFTDSDLNRIFSMNR